MTGSPTVTPATDMLDAIVSLEDYDHTSLLVYLDGGFICLDSNDLSDQVIVTNAALYHSQQPFPIKVSLSSTYKFVHSTSNHVLGYNDGSDLYQLELLPPVAANIP